MPDPFSWRNYYPPTPQEVASAYCFVCCVCGVIVGLGIGLIVGLWVG